MKTSLLFLFAFITCLISQPNITLGLETWEKLNMPDGAAVYSLAEGHNGAICALTSVRKFFVSINAGQSWNFMPDTIQESYNKFLTALDDGRLVAAADNRIFISSDNAKTWAALQYNSYNSIYHISTDKTNLYVGSFSGDIKIYDFKTGEWTSTDTMYQYAIPTSILVNNSGGIFVSTGRGLFYSQDRQSWSKSFFKDTAVRSIAFNSTDGLLASAGTGSIYYSSDNGSNWKIVYHDTLSSIDNIKYIKDKVLLASNLRGIIRSSDDGMSWQAVKGTTDSLEFYNFLPAKSGVIYAGSDDCVYLSTDAGKTWAKSFQGLKGPALSTVFASKDDIVFATSNRGIYRTTDLGTNWTFASLSSANAFLEKIMEAPNGSLFAYNAKNTLVRSTDKGLTWKSLTGFLDTNATTFAIAIDSLGAIYSYYPEAITSFYRKSSDNGNTWAPQESKFLRIINSLAFGKTSVLACSFDSVMFSADKGVSWKFVAKSFNISAAFVSPSDNLYYQSYSSIFKSTDKGSAWEAINTAYVYDLDFAWTGDLFCSISQLQGSKNVTDVYRNVEGKVWAVAGKGIANSNTIMIDVSGNKIYALQAPEYDIYWLPLPTENKRITLNVLPKDKPVLDWRDSLKFNISLRDEKNAPIDSTYIFVYDSLNHKSVFFYSLNGEASYTIKVPVATRDSLYGISFRASAPGFINNPILARQFEVKHTKFEKLSLNVLPEEMTDLDINDSDYVSFRSYVTNQDGQIAGAITVNILDSLTNDGLSTCTTDPTDGYCSYASTLEYGKAKGIYPIRFIAAENGWLPSDTVIRYINVVRSTSGMDDPEPGVTVNIAPNPCDSRLTVRFSLPVQAEARIGLFDLLGRPVMEQTGIYEPGSNHQVLDVESLPAGMYMMKITIGGEVLCRQVVIR